MYVLLVVITIIAKAGKKQQGRKKKMSVLNIFNSNVELIVAPPTVAAIMNKK